MGRFLASVRLKSGSRAAVREALRRGPLFDLEPTSLERHAAFLAGDELILLFEGEHADRVAKELLERADVLGAGDGIGAHVAEAPRAAEELFAWERLPELDGIAFGPQPGPGDSEGGPVE
jgi:hypothetical protein